MDVQQAPKKPAFRGDWHRADIKAALEKAGWTLRRLSLHHRYEAGILRDALRKRYPKAERLIASAIGVHPKVIWPSRYNDDGTPNSVRGRPRTSNGNSAVTQGHVKSARRD